MITHTQMLNLKLMKAKLTELVDNRPSSVDDKYDVEGRYDHESYLADHESYNYKKSCLRIAIHRYEEDIKIAYALTLIKE